MGTVTINQLYHETNSTISISNFNKLYSSRKHTGSKTKNFRFILLDSFGNFREAERCKTIKKQERTLPPRLDSNLSRWLCIRGYMLPSVGVRPNHALLPKSCLRRLRLRFKLACGLLTMQPRVFRFPRMLSQLVCRRVRPV